MASFYSLAPLFDGSVTAAKLAALAVETAKIANTAVTEAKLSLADNTTGDVSTTKHGFAPKAPNDATKFLNGAGAYAVPSSGGVWSEIAEISPSSGTNFEFTSIAAGYTEFRLCGYLKVANTGGGGVYLTFNNDGSGVYDYEEGRVYGGVNAGSAGANTTSILLGGCPNADTKVFYLDVRILNVAAGQQKVVVAQCYGTGGVNNGEQHVGGQWDNTAAEISNIDIDITGTAAAFVSGSRIWLLGRTN